MPDIDKVISQIEHCVNDQCCGECEYKAYMACKHFLLEKALVLLKQQAELLKEQEVKYPVCEKCGKEIDHINTSVFNYDGTDSDYSIPITYCKENGCVSFTTSQKWTGYYLTDEEQKEGICCPYCGRFPFDDSMEIEFYEPVEVMMWTSERSVEQDG